MKKIVCEPEKQSIASEQKELAQKYKKNKSIIPFSILLLCAEYIVYKLLLNYLPEEFFLKYNLFIILGLFFLFIIITSTKYFKKYLIEIKKYDIYKCRFDNFEEQFIYQYLWIDNKIETGHINTFFLRHKVYLSTNYKNYVEVENWGRNGKVINKKVTKFYLTKDIVSKIQRKENF